MKTIETTTPKETFNLIHRPKSSPPAKSTPYGDRALANRLHPGRSQRPRHRRNPVNSPTFTIVQIYESGRLPFYHFDVYRIGDIEEMEKNGYDDYFFGEGICLIEWAELIEELLPPDVIKITIEKDPSKGFDYRKITIEGLNE